ncbi:hypothetical protein [Frigoribacterium sp. SL97]|uniref:hypothetical protein n=1 Tax=Frigoribacterium sp. SL97 TaxID=2994664 RepID=UPI002270BA3D|nr:hypothetical protein [Frigoribacterium sp. SL97]WAC50540.1 hypothetical protein OVA02_11720 [Frigoribacterium sp. SL97]
MTTFTEAEHPRAAAGQFIEKAQGAPEVSLDATAPSPARLRLVAAAAAARQADQEVRAAAVEALQEEIAALYPGATEALAFRSYDDYEGYRLSTVYVGDTVVFDREEGDRQPENISSFLSNFGEDPTGLDEPERDEYIESNYGDYRVIPLAAAEVTA